MDASDYMMAELPPSGPPAEHIQDLKPDSGMPANVAAETVILGAILLDNAAFNEAAEHLEAEDFSLDSHRRIFLRISDLMDANQAVDIVTLSNELSQNKEIEAVGGVAYLASLTEGLPLRPVIEEYIRIVKNKSQLRRIMAICERSIARAADQSETAIEVLEDAESQLLEIAQEAVTGKLRTVADSVEVAGGIDEYLRPIMNPVAQTGLATGFYDVDRLTGGLKKGELILVAARPSVGKSAYALNIACNVVLNDPEAVVAFFSLEMTREALEKRALASIGRVNVRRAMSGEYLSAAEKEKLQDALGRLVESGLYIDDTPGMTPVQMRAKARRLKQRKGRLDLAILDYVQLASGGHKFESRRVEVAHVSRAMKSMAKELEIPVIALAQVSRQAEQRSDKRPMMADLRESGDLEADADVIEFLHRESLYNREDENLKGIAEVILAKNREGVTDVVRLGYMADCTLFMNLARG